VNDEIIKISVIIPIWNAGDRIFRCLDSLQSQTLGEIEFLCILDCPTDGTDSIVERYAHKDNRFKIIRNAENLYVDGSRNKALQLARGEYVGFMDHDDFCSPLMFEELYFEARETDSDVVTSNANSLYSDGRNEVWEFVDFSQKAMLESIILPMKKRQQRQQLSHCIWHSIYRTQFLKDNNIVFPSRKEYMDEDRLFNFQVYLSTEKISHVNKAFYTWVRYKESTSNTDGFNLAPRAVNRLEWIIGQLNNKELYSQYLPMLKQLVAFDLQTLLPYLKGMTKDYTVRFKSILKLIDFPIFSADYDLNFISRKRMKILLYLLKIMW